MLLSLISLRAIMVNSIQFVSFIRNNDIIISYQFVSCIQNKVIIIITAAKICYSGNESP